MGSVEADDERQIAVADDRQLQRLAHSSLTSTVGPYPGNIGEPSEQAYARPAPRRPASAAQYAVDVTVPDLLQSTLNPLQRLQNAASRVIFNDGKQQHVSVGVR